MSINSERNIEANLQIGPTDQGMVRIFIEAKGVEIPMDFDPEEAEEIAEENTRGSHSRSGIVPLKSVIFNDWYLRI